ncbi:DUF2690 domain-containing protein [Streptomyces sp. NPDC093223]|uniref:helix-turn-helix domain-containing protein n=1 Tax=Streptomyces sp. NPDC093223 TaxID=3366033 RepID=UPI00380744DE
MTPGAPSPSGARLAAVLQELKQRTGLSLAQLATATTFSKSSWERYLNSKGLPPRSAVEELCRLAGESADHALALLDIARTDRKEAGTQKPDRPDTGTPPDTDPCDATPEPGLTGELHNRTPTPSPDGEADQADRARADAVHPVPAGHRYATVLTALASACAVILGTLVLTHLPPSRPKETSVAATPSPATGPRCRHTACRNKDPITTNCAAVPLTLAEHETTTGAWIQIRYSPECGTSWARMWGAALGDRVEIRVGGRDGAVRSARVTSRGEADTYVHTLMSVMSPSASVQACFSPAKDGRTECVETHLDQAASSAWTPSTK